MKFSVDFSEIYQLLGENMKTPKLLYNKVVWNHPARYSYTPALLASWSNLMVMVYVGVLVHGPPRTRDGGAPCLCRWHF